MVTPLTALPASMAGLPGSRARVIVGPPLAASGPSKGFVFWRSRFEAPQPQLVPLSRLPPADGRPPDPEVPQAPGEAKIELFTVVCPRIAFTSAPTPPVAELAAKVLAEIVEEVLPSTAPPPPP